MSINNGPKLISLSQQEQHLHFQHEVINGVILLVGHEQLIIFLPKLLIKNLFISLFYKKKLALEIEKWRIE